MKKVYLLLVCLLCMLLTGCAGKLLAETEEEELPMQEAEAEVLIPTVAPDWSNWRWAMPGECGWNLYADDSGMPMLDREVKAENGELSFFLAHQWELRGYTDAGTVNILYFVSVNGELCDFERNGESSKQGMLFTKDMAQNEIYMDSFVVRNCNLEQGENTLAVFAAAYFPNAGHACAFGISRIFMSEETKSQTKQYTLAFEEIEERAEFLKNITVPTNASEDSGFVFKKISFARENSCMTVAAEDGLKVAFTNRAQKETENHAAVCLVLQNGELQSAWNGKNPLLRVSMPRTERITLPLSVRAEAGEHAQMSFIFLDLENGKTFVKDELFLFR